MLNQTSTGLSVSDKLGAFKAFLLRQRAALTSVLTGKLIFQGAAMTASPQLQQKLSHAVQTSMRIEGYAPQASPQAQAKAAELMKQQRVQVSVPSK